MKSENSKSIKTNSDENVDRITSWDLCAVVGRKHSYLFKRLFMSNYSELHIKRSTFKDSQVPVLFRFGMIFSSQCLYPVATLSSINSINNK